MDKEKAEMFALSKSEQGKNGMTVLRLGYVYHIIEELTKAQEKKEDDE